MKLYSKKAFIREHNKSCHRTIGFTYKEVFIIKNKDKIIQVFDKVYIKELINYMS